jgi:hypothetical protein
MNFQSVLIVTYGRSGSTLLQGILNSIPGCLIRGENFNFCEGLFLSYKAYLRTQQEHGGDPTTSDASSPWYGALHLDADQYMADMGAMVRAHLTRGVPAGEQPKCMGFKEIRYLSMEMHGEPEAYAANLHAYLDFLGRLLPGLGIVFLTREHAQVVKSAWWKTRSPEAVLAKLVQFESAAREYARNRINCSFIDYADLVRNDEVLASLFQFLGAPYNQAKVAEVLGQRHSYDVKPEAPRPQSVQLQLQFHDKPATVPAFKVDPLPPQLLQGRKFHLAGVVVAQGQANKNLSLCDDQGNEVAVKWGLPSPVIGKELPDMPVAKTSRFRSEELEAAPGAVYHLVLRGGQQNQEHRLATLAMCGEGAH